MKAIIYWTYGGNEVFEFEKSYDFKDFLDQLVMSFDSQYALVTLPGSSHERKIDKMQVRFIKIWY